MRTLRQALLCALSVLVFTSCTPRSTPKPALYTGDNPYAAQAGDSSLMRDDVQIDSASLVLAESQPPQAVLSFAYFQPTPCHSLRVEVGPPDGNHRIDIKAYAVAEKDKPCALMALRTPLQASLNLGSFPQGHYSVWLNEVQVGEFDS